MASVQEIQDMAVVKKHKKKKTGMDYLFLICNYAVFIIITILCAYPFYYIIINSLSANDLSASGAVNFVPKGIHFKNYMDVFKLRGLPAAALVSVCRTVIGAACSISFGDREYVVRAVIDSGDAFVIIQGKNENRHDDDLKSVDNKIVNGVIIDVSEENYRGEYALEVAGHHGYDGSGYYYVTDYLDIFPHMMLPARWSDFDFWKYVSDELGEISERRIYDDKDVIERFYYRQRRKINGYRLRSLVSVLLLLPCFIALKKIKKIKKLLALTIDEC